MRRIYLDYVEDIHEAMRSACRFVEGMDYASFAEDERTNFAVVRAIEIMGEATKNVPSDIWERFPDIPNALPAVGNCLETLLSEEKAQAGCGGSD